MEDLKALFRRITRRWHALTRGDVEPIRDPTVTFDFRLTAIYCSFCHRYGVYVAQIYGQEGRQLEVAHCPSCDAGWMIADRLGQDDDEQGTDTGQGDVETNGDGHRDQGSSQDA